MNATTEESVTAQVEWFTKEWRRWRGASFRWFWYVKSDVVSIAALRDVARNLKIENPATTRAALREQFYIAWVR
jgi:hypothetical protein